MENQEIISRFEEPLKNFMRFLKPNGKLGRLPKPLHIPFIKVTETFNSKDYIQNFCTENDVEFFYINGKTNLSGRELAELGYTTTTFGIESSKPKTIFPHAHKGIVLIDNLSDANINDISCISAYLKNENKVPEDQKSDVCVIVTYTNEFEELASNYIINDGYASWIE